MRAGLLRHRFELQSAADTRSESGAVVKAPWTTYAKAWGSIEPLTGNEYVDSDKLKANVTHTAKMRYRPGIRAKHRIVARGRTFQIEAVTDKDERRKEMILQLREQVQ